MRFWSPDGDIARRLRGCNVKRRPAQRLSRVRRGEKREEDGGTLVGVTIADQQSVDGQKAAVGTGWSPRNQTQGEPRAT
jgi:hypothetical protein